MFHWLSTQRYEGQQANSSFVQMTAGCLIKLQVSWRNRSLRSLRSLRFVPRTVKCIRGNSSKYFFRLFMSYFIFASFQWIYKEFTSSGMTFTFLYTLTFLATRTILFTLPFLSILTFLSDHNFLSGHSFHLPHQMALMKWLLKIKSRLLYF